MAKLESNIELEAAAFRRLLAHLDERKDAQNIDMMNLAAFVVTVYPNGIKPLVKNVVLTLIMKMRVSSFMACPTLSGKRSINKKPHQSN